MSIYSKATLGWSDNQITFNDYSSFPVYRAQTRSPMQFQVIDNNIPIPFESGINDFSTLIGQTIYVIKGTMYPKDEESYHSGIAALRAACSLDLQQTSDYNVDSGYVPYTWEESNDSKVLYVKALYVQIIEDTRQGYVQPFIIYLKVKDPIIYGATLKTATTLESDPVASTGSALYPFTYPIVFGAATYTSTSVATNDGTIPCYPSSIDIYGPTTNPKISNGKNGQYIQVNTTLSSVNDVLHIEYNNSELIVTLNGNSVVNNVTTDSDYFKIEPGENLITLSGSSVGSGAYANLYYRDAYALS